MPLSYRINIPPVGLPQKDFTKPIKMPEDLEPKGPRVRCDFGFIWSEESIKRLKKAYKEKYPVKEIALMFPDRTRKAVQAKISSLGLYRE